MHTMIRAKCRGEYFKFIPITLAAACLSLANAHAISNVWINEIHYDNASTDSGEGIEIAGAAGIDLTGFQLVFYNGSGGGAYLTRNLTGVIPDMQNGLGVVSFLVPGLQNGSPDGVALYDGGNNQLIQFLSYEGSFLAVGGPADGIFSIDVAVSEDGLNAVGTSLQLAGIGSQYSDFGWAGPVVSSPGAINPGQSFPQETSTSVPDTSSSLSLLSFALFFLSGLGRARSRFN